MRPAERAGAALWALALLAAGCTATNPAPAKWHRSVEQAQRSPYGAWVTVDQRNGRSVSGELIAVEPGRLLVGGSGALIPVATGAIDKVTVSAYATDNDGMILATGLGTLSTISHGFLLVISMPLWALIGVGLNRSVSREGFLVADDAAEIADLRRWARFPQGLPECIFVEKAIAPGASPGASGPAVFVREVDVERCQRDASARRAEDEAARRGANRERDACLATRSRLAARAQAVTDRNERVRILSSLPDCGPVRPPPPRRPRPPRPVTPPAPPPSPEVPRGGDGQVCYPNGSCNGDLICDRTAGRCRAAPALGAEGGRCYASGACEDGLVCQEGTCARSP